MGGWCGTSSLHKSTNQANFNYKPECAIMNPLTIDLAFKKAAAKGKKVLAACKSLPWYKRWGNTIWGWFGSKLVDCQALIENRWMSRVNKALKEVRKGEVDAMNLAEKLPSFVDTVPFNKRVDFLDRFMQAKSVILKMDALDRIFMRHLENLVVAWASQQS